MFRFVFRRTPLADFNADFNEQLHMPEDSFPQRRASIDLLDEIGDDSFRTTEHTFRKRPIQDTNAVHTEKHRCRTENHRCVEEASSKQLTSKQL
eukprot:6392112-Prymnesium_polylepis.1